MIEALRQLDVLDENDVSPLSAYAPIQIKNRRGDLVGEARAAFTLDIDRQ